MSKFLKEKWQDVCAAKKAKKAAESEIVVTAVEKPDDVCIVNEIRQIPEESKDKEFPLPMIKVCHCEYFSESRVCENADCPMHDKNEQYIEARLEYKRVRGEFFNILFYGRKNYFNKR